MESQQIMELLLSIQAEDKAWRERMETNRQADRERTETNHDDLIKTVKEEMRAMVYACHKEMMACLGKTEADTEKPDPDSGMMQSTEEHQEFAKKDAAVMPVGEPRKRRRVRNLAAERRQKQKERIRITCESRRKSAASCRKVSRRATVAWRKRNLVRKIEIPDNCEPWKRWTVTGRKTTSRTTVAWRSENFVRKNWIRNQAKRGIPKRRGKTVEMPGIQQWHKEPRC
jgi:hypothetical protein